MGATTIGRMPSLLEAATGKAGAGGAAGALRDGAAATEETPGADWEPEGAATEVRGGRGVATSVGGFREAKRVWEAREESTRARAEARERLDRERDERG